MPSRVGQVVEIVRYPVKSMAADALSEAELDWQGLEGDRQFSFYRKDDSSRFPWLSGRDLPDLVRFKPAFRKANDPRRSSIEVTTPGGERFDLQDPQLLRLLSESAGCELGLLQVGRGTYDSMPLSIATTGAHLRLDAAHGWSLDRRRFRSNIVIEANASPAEWLSKRLLFGTMDAAQLLVTADIPRCALITVDPDTGLRDPKALRTVAQSFGNSFGVYATPSRPGRLRVRDPVYVID